VSGKDPAALLAALLRAGDSVFPVEISRASLPARLAAVPPAALAAAAAACGHAGAVRVVDGGGLEAALDAAAREDAGVFGGRAHGPEAGPGLESLTVVCGSLHLGADLERLRVGG